MQRYIYFHLSLQKTYISKKNFFAIKIFILLSRELIVLAYMVFLRVILFPISILYGIITYIRNKFFDWNIFSSKEFAVPIISVGNLSVGGTGKTPHIEYLIHLLSSARNLAKKPNKSSKII